MELEQQFVSAQERVKTLSQKPSNMELLALYSLFKQATEGDVSGSRPGMFDIKGAAKYDAWANKKGLSKEQAMQDYIALVDKLHNN